MPQFKLSPEGFATVKKRSVIRFAIIFIICASASLLIGNQRGKVDEDTSLVINGLLLLVLLVVFTFSFRRSLKQVKELYFSYTIIIDGATITRLQQNTPTVTIPYAGITSISKLANGNLVINGTNRGDVIYIPPSLEGLEELEGILEGIQPISQKSKLPFVQQYNLVISLLVVVLMICVYVVNNKIIVGISGAIVSLALVWGLYDIQRNKNIDRKTRRGALWALVVLFSVVTATIIKLRL
jgi:hypothetical protein